MEKHGVFESVNMKSTRGAERIFDAVCENEIENGTFGYLDGLDDGSDVVYKFVPGIKSKNPIVVVDQPAWNYDESHRVNQRRDEYVIPANTKFRVRVVSLLDEFGINDAVVTEDSKDKLKVNAYLTINSSGKLVASETTDDSFFAAKVLRNRISGNTVVTTGAGTYGYSDKIYECSVTTLNCNAATPVQ